jgi:hypothetical protein
VLVAKLYIDIIELACGNGYRVCLESAQRQFQNWLTDPNRAIGPNIKPLVFKYGIQSAITGTAENWKLMRERYDKELIAQEKLVYLRALSWTKNRQLLKE